MLLKFELENWTSFRDRTVFSCVATREKRHRGRLPRVQKFRMSVLPVAAIFGGNASGKTNFFRALAFARNFVVQGTKPDLAIPVKSFLLDKSFVSSATRFSFELLIDELVYELTFVVDTNNVLKESVTRISSAGETVLYERQGKAICFDGSLKSQKDSEQYLNFIHKGTRANELFLTKSVAQDVAMLKPVYTWFRDQLELIDPDTSFELFNLLVDEASPLANPVCSALAELDTGITGLTTKNVSLEDLGFPDKLYEDIRQKTKAGNTVLVKNHPRSEHYLLSTDSSGVMTAGRLVTLHSRADGSTIEFDLRNEADGTKRAIDLLPAFCILGNPGSNQVFVIDELDRSLHSLLTRKLLATYLQSCTATSRSQLIFSTHDLLLMDQDLLRRDEMWVAERGNDGCSTLYSFSEFAEMRYDKDIRRSYLQGRLGGIARLLYDKPSLPVS
jgi:AAA15 family ATPase/GTPase